MDKCDLLLWLGDQATREELIRLVEWCRDDHWARTGEVYSQTELHRWALVRIADEIRGCDDPCADEWADVLLGEVQHPPLSWGDLWFTIRLEIQIANSLIQVRAKILRQIQA